MNHMADITPGVDQGTTEIQIPNPLGVYLKYEDDDFVKEVAKTLFAAAPLIEIDDKGNISQISDAKVELIAAKYVKYAKILKAAVDKNKE